MEWREKTCEKCMYRDGALCRKNPPLMKTKNYNMSIYPVILFKGSTKLFFNKACSYLEEINYE